MISYGKKIVKHINQENKWGIIVNISLTKDEYSKFIQLCSFLVEHPNPCIKCSESERASCLGCKEEKEWKVLKNEKAFGIEDFLELKQTKDHILNVMKYSNILEKLNELIETKNQVEKQIFDFEHSVFPR